MYSTLYWLTRLDGLHDLMGAAMICAGIVGTFLGVFGYVAFYDLDIEGERLKALRKWFKICVAVVFIVGAAKTFLPTKNEAILIYAGGKTWEYVQSDTSLQKLPYKATDYIKTVLENEIKEAKEEASK